MFDRHWTLVGAYPMMGEYWDDELLHMVAASVELPRLPRCRVALVHLPFLLHACPGSLSLRGVYPFPRGKYVRKSQGCFLPSSCFRQNKRFQSAPKRPTEIANLRWQERPLAPTLGAKFLAVGGRKKPGVVVGLFKQFVSLSEDSNR